MKTFTLPVDVLATDRRSGYFDHFLPADLDVGNEVAAEERLEALGVSESAMPEVIEMIESEAKREAWHKTAEVLAWIGKRLASHSTTAASVAVALGIHDGSMAEIGARFGVTKQATQQLASRLKPYFPEMATPAKPEAPIARPTEPGDWLTSVEAEAVGRHSVDRIRSMAGVVTTHFMNRVFYERASLLAAVAAEAIQAAELKMKSQHRQKYD